MFSLCVVARLDTAMRISNGIKRESGGSFPLNSGESEVRPPKSSLIRMNLAENTHFGRAQQN